MHEIRIHGRGGQGAVLAGSILATAFVAEGKHVVAVPSFGFERRGAPVASFLRVDDKPIRQMTNIYRPDCILCIDPTVARAVNIFDGVTDDAVLVQTTAKPLADLALPAADRDRSDCATRWRSRFRSSSGRSPTRSCSVRSRARPASFRSIRCASRSSGPTSATPG